MRRFGRHAVFLWAVSLALAAPGASAAPVSTGYSEQVVASGLSAPTAIAFLPDGRMLVTEKEGALKLVQGGAATTLTTIPVCTASEMGLLGIAVDPNFTSNGFVYLYRTKPAPSGCGTATGRFNQVVRVTMSDSAVVPGSLTELLTGIRTTNGNHDGGGLRIGPDNKLWVAVGDAGVGDSGGPGQSTNPYTQDLGALEGKILRLELNGSPAAGNPYIGQPPARPEVYARGFRNPFRMDFDPQTGRFWVGDVGQGAREEIDVVQRGGNYAWPRCEGTLPIGCQLVGDIDPVFEYPHSGTGSLGRVVTGGTFLPRGFGAVGGRYVFGDYTAGALYIATPNAARTDIGTPATFVTGADGPVDIVVGPDGALYWAAIVAGHVRKLVPGYPRPKSAAYTHVPLVPAHLQCAAPNRTHGPPLAFDSCSPPVPQSSQLTVGTPDANGEAAESSGFVSFRVVPGNPVTPADEADVTLRVLMTDVRSSGLADYTGQLRATTGIRITDRDNAASAGSPAATVVDDLLAWTVPCTGTTDTGIGSTCSVTTSVDSVVPGAIKERRRSVWQLKKVLVLDGGPDGLASTAPNTIFAAQGVFVR